MVRVLCVSLRAGGGSTGAALRQLGYRVFTVELTFQQRRLPTQWARVLSLREHFSEKLLEGFDASAGLPAAAVWDRVLAKSPAYTKVVLVDTGDEAARAAWAAEFHSATLPAAHSLLAEGGRSQIGREWAEFFRELWPRELLCATPEETAAAVEKFEALVREAVHPKQLLVFRPSEGWGPLCDFLDVPPPDAPFPPEGPSDAEFLATMEHRLRRAGRLSKMVQAAMLAVVLWYTAPMWIAGLRRPGEVVPAAIEELRRDYEQAYGKGPTVPPVAGGNSRAE